MFGAALRGWSGTRGWGLECVGDVEGSAVPGRGSEAGCPKGLQASLCPGCISPHLEYCSMKAGPISVWLPSLSPEPFAVPGTPQALTSDGLVVDGGTQ